MKNLHSWNYFYTTAGRDSRDKFQVWLGIIPKKYHFFSACIVVATPSEIREWSLFTDNYLNTTL